MEKVKLEKNDFVLVKDLIKITKSNLSLHQKMSDLEIKDQKKTQEYNKQLEYLNMVIECENKIYKKLDLNYEKCSKLVNYIKKERLPYNYLGQSYESIISQDYNNIVERRIIRFLNHQKNKYANNYNYDINQPSLIYDLGSILLMIPIYIDSIDSETLISLKNTLKKDLLNNYLWFVQDTISKDKKTFLKKDLICSKYNTIFINKNMEYSMINSKFNIDSIHLNSNVVADDLNLDNRQVLEMRNNYGLYKSLKQINEIINKKDIEYRDSKKILSLKLRQCLLKSAFLLTEDEYISKMRGLFNSYVSINNFQDGHHQVGIQYINECFDTIIDDKTNIYKLNHKNI